MSVLAWLKKHLHRAFHGNSQLGRQADLVAIFHQAQMPDTLGSLQGNIDFWCNYFWQPYWLSLSVAERLQYPENWQEFSEFH
jgi:hypothetical protein